MQMNYIEDGTFGATSRAYNQRAIKMRDLMAKKKKDENMPLLMPNKTLSKQKSDTEVDLAFMDIEFEFRTSKLIDLVC